MSIELLKEASSAGVSLFLSHGKLKVRANKGALTDELRQRILDAKDEVVALLAELDGVRSEDESDAIKPALRRDGRLPLSYQQQRLWVLNELQPGNTGYNMPFAFRIRGSWSIPRAQKALDEVMARHEVLRTAFHRDDEDIYQSCSADAVAIITNHDLTHVAVPDRDRAVKALIDADAHTPFDLERAPLIRVAWIALSADEGVLYFNVHHLVFDGWSIDVLLRDFITVYRGLGEGGGARLLPLPIQYADYAVWQRRRLNDGRVSEHRAYWMQALSGASAMHSLPLEFERPRMKQHVGDVVQGRVTAATLAQLQVTAGSLNITLFMLLHGALSLVLARYGSDPDVVIGTPVANRDNSQLDELVGFFINTLVLRVNCDESKTIGEYFRDVCEANLAAHTHQDIPFEMLLETLDVPRSMAHSPLFQVMLSLDNNTRAASSQGLLEVEPFTVGIEQAKYDLTLHASVGSDGLSLGWVYDVALFDEGTIRRLDSHLVRLLDALPGDAGRTLRSLESLPPTEYAALAPGLAGPVVDVDHSLMPHLRVAETARRTPHAIALFDGINEMTYAELDRKVDHLAHLLRARGIESQDRIGIILVPSPAMVVTLLAVMRVGAAYVPIDAAATQSHVDHVVSDSGLKLLLTSSDLPDRTRGNGLPACYLEEIFGDETWRTAAHAEAEACDEDMLAYILYTSGSTGRPKGVAITRHGLCNYLGHCVNAYVCTPFEEAVMSSPLTFDATITTLFTPLVCGRRLRVLHAGQEALAAALGELMLGDEVPRLFKLTPAHLDMLASYWREQGESRQSATASLVIVGGEQLLKKTLEPFLGRFTPRASFINEYGPTETVVGCCTYAVRSIEDLQGGSAVVPIGRPIQNTWLHVCQGERLAPLGAVGELFIGGAGVARGYLNQPALHDRHFVPREIAGRTRRLYRTGDLVRLGIDGQLVFFGRNDEQIKLRGYRIEPAEIESRLCEFPGVREACVLLSDQLAAQALVAYVAMDDTQGREDAIADRLREWCKDRLAAHFIPATFRFVALLPVTANGKVDKRALLALPLHVQPTASYVAPESTMQQVLCEVFASLLKRTRVGVNENFFSLGGDSILAIQAVSRARKAGVGISTQLIVEHQTVAELSRHAVDAGGRTAGVQATSGPFALTPIQRWFVHAQPEALDHYNQSLLLEGPGELTAGILSRVIEALLARHDVLRATFDVKDGEWQAFQHPFDERQVTATLHVEALPDGVEASRAFIAERCRHYQASLNLRAGPLFRVVLFSGAPRTRVFIVAHHMVVDGVSWRIVLDDFERAYRQAVQGEAIMLGSKGTSYRYWSELLSRHADGAELMAQEDYWRERSNAPGFGYVEYPAAEPPTVSTSRQAILELSAEQTEALLTHANVAFTTQTQDILLGALYLGLVPWAIGDTFRIDLEGHGREMLEANLDLSDTVGWFTCIYPQVLRGVEGDLGETLRTIKEDMRAVPRGGVGGALFAGSASDILFNYLGQLDRGGTVESVFTLANEDSGQQIAAHARRTHKLAVTAFIVGGRMRITLDYSDAEFSAETANSMVHAIASAVDGLLAYCAKQARPMRTPSDFPLAKLRSETLDRLQANEDVQDIYPSTPTQQGMLASIDLDPSAYVTQFYPLLRGHLDAATLREGWQGVTDQHAVLRTRFAELDGAHYQIVRTRLDACIDVVDLSGHEPAEQEAQFATLRQEEKLRGFSSDQSVFYRLVLVRLDATTHRLLFTCHHCIFDGWSMPLVVNQLLENVKRLGTGGTIARGMEADYRDYVSWLGKQDRARAEAFWRDYLNGAPEPARLKLPVPPRQDVPMHGLTTGLIGIDETREIRELAKRQGVTLNTLMQFAWAVALSAYSGSSDVTFGAVISGRPPELENVDRMVGVFINTIPVRLRLNNDGLKAQLAELQKTFHEADRNGYLAYSEIKKAVGIDAPLFEAVLDFKNYPMDEQPEPDDARALILEDAEAHGTSSFDIVAAVGVYDRIMFNCTYRRDRYDERYMSQLISHVSDVLVALARGTEPGAIRLQPEAWCREGLSVAAATVGGLAMHQRFEQIAADDPHRPAVSHAGATLSFIELDRRANRIAHLLARQGVTAGEPVGLMLRRGLDFVAGVLGILKAGAAYVPIDPAYPADRKIYMIEDANLRHVLHDQASRMTSLTSARQHAIDDRNTMVGYPDDRPAAATATQAGGEEGLAYVIYTSGSTGRPKGVMVGHAELRNFAEGMLALDLCGKGTWAAVASFSFDASVQGLCHLMQGGHLVVLTEDERIDAALLRSRLAAHAVDIVDCTPTLLESWIEQGVEDILPTLVVGGERLPERLWQRLAARCGTGLRQFNAYGPTECTVNAMVAVVEGESPHIGTCLPNVVGLVLDASMKPCPPAVAGELYIAGKGVTRGYLGNPDLTAERFVHHPSSGIKGTLYRTGDAARRLPDGRFEYLGRLDEQVKINGYRIELGEIAGALGEHPSVDSALVILDEADSGRTQLVACVRPADGVDSSLIPDQLAPWVRKHLPEYMRPHRYIAAAAWPMTANGKIDREKLLSMEGRHAVTGRENHPRSAIQALLVELFAQALGKPTIGIDDNFYELGGDSILAIRLVAHAGKAGIKIRIRDLVSHPSVRLLSEVCEVNTDMATQPAVSGKQHLMPIHHEVMIEQWDAGANVFEHFNGGSLFGLAPGLTGLHLRAIYNALLKKHDALRLAFDIDGHTSPSARYLPIDDPSLAAAACVEQVPADEADIPSAVKAICLTHQTSFQLARGGLLKLVLIKASDTDRLLVLGHHAIADVVSWHVLVADIGEAVTQCQAGQPVVLAGKTSSYQAWGEHLAECARNGTFAQETGFWATQLATDGLADVPLAEDVKPAMGHRRYEPVVLDAEATATLLQGLRSTLQTDIDTGLLTALYRGLSRWRGKAGFRFLMETHGRHNESTELDLSHTVGWFTQSYPLRLDFEPATPEADIASVAARLASVPEHGIGYGVLRFLIREPALLPAPESKAPFQILFNYLGQFSSMVREAGPLEFLLEDIGSSAHERLPLTAPMAFQGGVYGGKLSMNLEYDARHFDAAQSRKLAACIRDELMAIVAMSNTVPSGDAYTETN